MVIKTSVPKGLDKMYYLGKPVKDSKGERIGSITDVIDDGDYITLEMNIEYQQPMSKYVSYSVGQLSEE